MDMLALIIIVIIGSYAAGVLTWPRLRLLINGAAYEIDKLSDKIAELRRKQ